MFTYGPLGFLSVPAPFYGWSSALATVATFGVYLALTAMLLVIARRLLPLWAAALVVLLVGRLYGFLPPFEAIQAAVFVAGVEVLANDEARDAPGRFRRSDGIALTCGLAAGVLGAGKLNVAVFTAAMLFVIAVARSRPWWRGGVVFIAVGAVTFIAIWILTGQSLANLPAFAFGSLETIRGYAEAMVVDTHPTLRWVYAAFVALVGLLAWLGWLAMRDLPRRRLIAIAALGAILAFAEWKTAFTRNYTYYAMITALIALFPFVSRLTSPDRRTIAGLAFAFAFIVSMATTRIDPIDVVDVRVSVRSAASMAAAMLPWRQADAVERTRAEIRDELAIPDDVLRVLQAETVHVDPWQTIAMAAYPDLRWSPLPIFQSYSAYTTALDEINADVLRTDNARTPTRILRERTDNASGQPLAVDNRFVWFEQPATTLETICRYEEVAADDRWQALARSAGAACGEAQSVGAVTAKAGEPVTVPGPSSSEDIFLVRISGFPSGLFERLKTLLYRADEWYIE
ncbi:MAG TPA: hypothetical protein VFV72_06500, partial [Candidatus Limnocylindrales bacterium]|nr:hypothetical protein [Candidatus Limnocylindrales bacterium]